MGLFGFGKKKQEKHVDPVCGMDVDPKSAAGKAEHDGIWFYFCSETCLDTFMRDPHRYAHGPGH